MPEIKFHTRLSNGSISQTPLIRLRMSISHQKKKKNVYIQKHGNPVSDYDIQVFIYFQRVMKEKRETEKSVFK